MNSGVIFGISPDWRGDTLIVDAAAGDAVLQVKDACDFDEVFPAARFLVIGDENTPRQYIATDMEANTVTLAAPVGGTGLEAGLPVVLWDPTVGTAGARSVEYIAKVELHDGSGAPDVTIPHEMIPAAGVYNLVGASVTIDEDDDGDLVISEVLGRENVTDGAYVALGDGTSLEDIYSAANAAAAAAADAAANATTAMTAANGKNKVTYSLSTPGATANAAGDIWFQKDSSTQTIIGQWIGGGGTTWVSTQLRNEVIANLDAGKLTAGSAFTNALTVKTNLTLGDASTDGVIQSYNFASSSVGVFLSKSSVVLKGGSLSAAAVTGSTFSTAGSFPITIAGAGIGWSTGAAISETGTNLTIQRGSSAVVLSSSGVNLSGLVSGSFIGSFSGSASGSWTSGDITTGASDDVRHHSLDKPGGGSGNAYVYAGGTGLLSRGAEITSQREAKVDVVPLEIDPDAWAELGVYRFRYPGSEHESAGFMLDEFQAAGFDLWVATNEDGEPGGLHYSHVTVGHQAMLRDHHPRIAELEKQNRAKDELIRELRAEVGEVRELLNTLTGRFEQLAEGGSGAA